MSNEKYYIGIDNGISGSIGIVERNEGFMESFLVPTKSGQDYTKKKQNVTRIDSVKLKEKLLPYCTDVNCFAILERPLNNPTRMRATLSALRALESTLVILEDLKIPYQFIDSKEWQKLFLPNIKGDELKAGSFLKGKQLFPMCDLKHKDLDGLLIAEYARRKNY